MGLQKWLTNLIHSQVHSAGSQTSGHLLKTCKRTLVQAGNHLRLEVCNCHALTLRGGVQSQYRCKCQISFFKYRDLGHPVCRLINWDHYRLINKLLELNFNCIFCSCRRGVRTTHYWGWHHHQRSGGLSYRECPWRRQEIAEYTEYNCHKLWKLHQLL